MKVAAVPYLLIIALPTSLAAIADTVSKPCPFTCKTESLDQSQCDDWREGDLCYVRDPSLKAEHHEESLERVILFLNKDIDKGSETVVDLKDEPVSRIDVVVQRRGSETDTKLELKLDKESAFGAPMQVDNNEPHVVRFTPAQGSMQGEQLVLHALNGPVTVESVHVFYENNEG